MSKPPRHSAQRRVARCLCGNTSTATSAKYRACAHPLHSAACHELGAQSATLSECDVVQTIRIALAKEWL
ncbi:MAG: hypothetical protein ACU4EQ_13250 [Candidatus Nitrosoglobus sp.]